MAFLLLSLYLIGFVRDVIEGCDEFTGEGITISDAWPLVFLFASVWFAVDLINIYNRLTR